MAAQSEPKKRRVATTPEEREKQLQALAFDLAERHLEKGTASSQLVTQLLKGGGIREQLELERLRNENRLLNARIDGMEAAARMEASIEEALRAFKSYQGEEVEDPDPDDPDLP